MERIAEVDPATGLYSFACPHCELFIEVERGQVNCRIFRHAYFFVRDERGMIRLTEQLNPHAPKEICERLIKEGRIYGCGKPFEMQPIAENKYIVKSCEYI